VGYHDFDTGEKEDRKGVDAESVIMTIQSASLLLFFFFWKT